MKAAQCTIALLIVAGLLRGLWTDFYGVKNHEPYGFLGVVISIAIFILMVWLNYTAGAFSLIIF